MSDQPARDTSAPTLGEAIGSIRVDTAVVLLGAVALAVGSLGTWASVGALSVSGTHGSDGKITLGAAVLCVVGLGIARFKRGWGAVILLVLGAVGLGTGGYDLIHASHAVGGVTLLGVQIAHIGWGLYAVVAGGALVILGAGLMLGPILRTAIPTAALVAGAAVMVTAVALQSTSSATSSSGTAARSTGAIVKGQRHTVSVRVPTTSFQTASPPTTTTAPDVEDCPTSYGITGPHRIPSNLSSGVALPPGLIFYANAVLAVVAPRGWSCSGGVGVDGAANITVTPGGRSEAITATDGGACSSCNDAIACPLIPAAAEALQSPGIPCPSQTPTAERISRINATTVAFEDPPYVHGTGSPSGGTNPANGVIIYSPRSFEAFEETCTLPEQQHSICTAILNDFIGRYHG